MCFATRRDVGTLHRRKFRDFRRLRQKAIQSEFKTLFGRAAMRGARGVIRRATHNFHSSSVVLSARLFPTSVRHAWSGTGGPSRGDGSRIGRHDERPLPPPVCSVCNRRFCSCSNRVLTEPQIPGPEDCCQSIPQCKFCVWTVYEEQLEEYRKGRE